MTVTAAHAPHAQATYNSRIFVCPHNTGTANRALVLKAFLQLMASTCNQSHKTGTASKRSNSERAPVSFMPIITMRATQKKMMSWPVSSSEVG